ncbi:MAG: DUF2059 domain-containing protein [Sphingomonadales bacterium]|nr:DUF2059 domain-containing protein [Sphingomonadales bacterium]
MKRMLTLLAGAAMASVPALAAEPAKVPPPPIYVPAPPPSPAPPPVRTEAGFALAQRLTLLVLPPEVVIEQNREAVALGFDAEAKKSPELGMLLEQHPGLRTKLIDTGKRELDRILAAGLPDMQRSMAEFYVRNLDEATLRTVVEFYETDLGRKLVQIEYQSIDTKAVTDSRFSSTEEFTRSDVDQLYSGVEARMVKALTPQERTKVATFTLSPAGRKLFRLTSQTKDLSVKLINDLIGPHRAELEAAYAEAVAEYFSSGAAAN